MNDWKEEFGKAVLLWTEREKIASSIYSSRDRDEIAQLVQLEVEYEQITSVLAANTSLAELSNYLELQLPIGNESTQVSIHIILKSQHAPLVDMLLERLKSKESYFHQKISRVLRVCEQDIIVSFCRKAYALSLPWVEDQFAEVIGKNMLAEFSAFYINGGRVLNPTMSIVSMLGYLGSPDFVPPLLQIVQDEAEDILIRRLSAKSLLMCGDDRGMEFYRMAFDKRLDDATLAFTIGRYASKSEIQFLIEQLPEISAVDALVATLRSLGFSGDINVIEQLLPYLSHAEEEVRAAASEGISDITGEWNVDQFGAEEELVSFWRSWLSENIDQFDKGVRYEDGEPFSLATQASLLLDTDRESREVRHEALMIFSGLHLPFDERSYYANQYNQASLWTTEIEPLAGPLEATWIRSGHPV
ncbi:HEAT repeat domain-containing protein [Hahella sp. NBU794]|uniref:HEAT repeat domain-containing protein n=1 Tax=Hahella sp. NBU794 TaxID=3422590 RepID=UPI003D6ECE78